MIILLMRINDSSIERNFLSIASDFGIPLADIEICTDNPCVYAGAECPIHLTFFFKLFIQQSCMNLSSYATINSCRRRIVTDSIQQQNKLR